MKIAILKNGLVQNVVVGDLDSVSKLFPEVIAESEATNIAWIGARWNGKRFEAQRIFDSWIWNESTFDYDPPKPKPVGDFYWDEEELEWLQIEIAAEGEEPIPITGS